jgi:3-dehydroquinate dehydratase-2
MRPSERNIVLIGMPGVGKTTVGRLVSANLKREFYDSDAEIEADSGETCAEFISSHGEDGFRRSERAVIRRLLEKRGIVIAVGGGAPVYNEDLLRKNSVVVYLCRPLEDIAKSLDNTSRPLSKSLDDLKSLADARGVIYERCADAVITSGSAEDAAAAVVKEIGKYMKAKILVLNGPNLNMLGIREPTVYGNRSYADLCDFIRNTADERGIAITFKQSNHEGELIDIIQSALDAFDGIVINPGAYTHYSYAIHDALKAAERVPAAEVHISDIKSREVWRQTSVTAPACVAQISGRGFQGYVDAIDLLLERLETQCVH